MRAVIQRVSEAVVIVDGDEVGRIGTGLLVYLGVASEDTGVEAAQMAEKIRHLRIFPDDAKPLNRDVGQAGGAVLMVSAFTTMADARKGRRPALGQAAEPAQAEQLYDQCCDRLSEMGVVVERGRFRAHMDVSSVNDGPICVLVDSQRVF